MEYTQCQINTLNDLNTWKELPNNEDTLFYTVNGAAGTGKTTIVNAFLQNFKIKSSQVAVTAPTHKAKKVIEDSTNYKGSTIQKLLGLRPNTSIDNFNINRPQFDPLGEDEISFYKFIIIDESSMLNKDIFELIQRKALENNVKVLFLGDEYQLPPVNESMSKVFTDVKYMSTLIEVVRQNKVNPMSPILKILREDVKDGTQKGLEELVKLGTKITNEQGFKCLAKKLTPHTNITFNDAVLEQYYSTEYSVNPNYMKFISYTNRNVQLWNIAFRKQILKEKADKIIIEGEFLLSYNTITDKHNNTIIQNSEDYKVVKVIPDSVLDIDGFYCTIENSNGYESTVFIVDHTNPKALNKFKLEFNTKLKTAKINKGNAWRTYYNFKNKVLLLVDLYYDNESTRLMVKKDLFYNYGLTVHKSQGSTYDNVAINIIDLYRCRDVYERNRLIYVALSRAKNMNILLIQ